MREHEACVDYYSSRQGVQSLLLGSVVDINVTLGSKVKEGDVLFRLEDDDVSANFADNEIALNAARAAEIMLSAEADGLKQLHFPSDLMPDFVNFFAKESSLFVMWNDALHQRLLVLDESIETLHKMIAEKQAEHRIPTARAALVAEEINLLEPLVGAGHEPSAIPLAAKSRHQEALGIAELALLSASAREADFDGKRREMDSTVTGFWEAAGEALIIEQTKAAQLQARQDALRGKVRHADVRAPLAGTVSAVHVKTVGEVVQAGTMLVEIVPGEAENIVRAQILPQDVADVKVGQTARISLSAYDLSRYGVLMGKVRQVATNTTQPENAMPFYETIIAIPLLPSTNPVKCRL